MNKQYSSFLQSVTYKHQNDKENSKNKKATINRKYARFME